MLRKAATLFSLFVLATSFIFAQGLTSYGAKIRLEEGAKIQAGNITIESESEIMHDGEIQLTGDWTNNTENPFQNIEPTPNGILRFSGNTQSIRGDYPSNFENISIDNTELTLYNEASTVKGILSLEGTLILNSHRILLLNPSPEALNHISGFIMSESAPAEGLGELVWEIGENTGDYLIPFGSGNDTTSDLQISLHVLEEVSAISGSFSFATYPTDYDNLPFPDGINGLDPLNAQACIDRFYKIEPTYSINPEVSIFLAYDDASADDAFNLELNIDALQLSQYDRQNDSWISYEHLVNNTGDVGVNRIQSNQLFGWFTLSSLGIQDLDIPNGITPNGDDYNDVWILTGCDQCKVKIYNRWGNLIFESDNYDNNWNGDDNPSGAYYYVIEEANGNTHTGDLNILR